MTHSRVSVGPATWPLKFITSQQSSSQAEVKASFFFILICEEIELELKQRMHSR